LDFLGQALADADFLLKRKPVHMTTDFAVADGLDVFFRVSWIYGVLLRHGLFRARLLSLLLRRLRLSGVLLWGGLALGNCEGWDCQKGAAKCQVQGLPQDGVHKHLRLPISIHPKNDGRAS